MIDFQDPFLWIYFLFGLIFGSFANVVIVRMPRGESIIFPGSRCTSSGLPLAWYDNIPVLSWVFLLGRSRHDGSFISVRYPAVELIMGVMFSLCYIKFGNTVSTIEALILCFGLVSCSFIDFEHYILPDQFTLGGIVIGLIGSLLNPERTFLEAFLGFFFGGGILYAIAYFYLVFRNEEGMGGGDIKLLGWLGAVLGWKCIPFVLIGSSFLGLLGGLVYAIRSGDGMKTVLPFGPFIALAALLYLFGYWPSAEVPPIPLFQF